MSRAPSMAVGIIILLTCPRQAWAQESAPAAEAEPAAAVPSPGVSTPYQDSLGLTFGLIRVTSEQPLEVDKDGPAFGARAFRTWMFPSSLTAAVGLGLLTTTVKGDGPYTNGDQEARLTTPWLEGAVGYAVSPEFGLQAGLQLWFGKGSNFSPEADEKGNQPFVVLRARYAHEAIKPCSLSLEYVRGMQVDDRLASGTLLGLDFSI